MSVGRERLVALAAGGTGGHMFPAEALAQEMRRRGWRIILFTDARGMRFGQNFPADTIIELPAANPNVRGVLAKFGAGAAMGRGLAKATWEILRHKPDVLVGFGGYPSAPAMVAARLLGKPYGLHEQNAVLGRVNRLVAPKAGFIAHGFEQLSKLPTTCQGNIVPVGNPVRDAIRQRAGIEYLKPTAVNRLNLFVFGGSQGASLFSHVVPEAVAGLPSVLQARLSVTQQVRDAEIDSVQITYNKAGVPAELTPFFADMPDQLTKAHLVISRAGASSVTELAMVGRPAILVPLGIAMDDHQTGNAQVLVTAGAATLVREAEFQPEVLRAVLVELLADPDRLAQMASAARSVAAQDASVRLAGLIEGLIEA